LLDGHLTLNADFGLKLLVAAITALPIFLPQSAVQKAVAADDATFIARPGLGEAI
jgi:hypothetical protein